MSAQTDEMSSTMSVDFTVLDKLRVLQDEGEDVVAELVGLFLDDTPARIAAVRDAVEAKDTGRLDREAHGLKGSSATIGAPQLRVLCESLERLGKSGRIQGADALVVSLEDEFQRVRAMLDPLRASTQ
jgi:HPt (histidine-containing phosphotransfer) domain-containing protein